MIERSIKGLPHARGGVSSTHFTRNLRRKSSPRSWGCFHLSQQPVYTREVFPTLVGVFLIEALESGVIPWSSLRSWGCFSAVDYTVQTASVFPTLVGVFLFHHAGLDDARSLPHARGGVSLSGTVGATTLRSSPRSWGCFLQLHAGRAQRGVFPTLVGVFLSLHLLARQGSRLPHARGGVSNRYRQSCSGWRSSPRSWGCFHQGDD